MPLYLFVFLFLSILFTNPLYAYKVGTNLDAVNYWTPTMPFTDAMRMADRWSIYYKKGGKAPSDGIAFDDRGFPLALTPHDDGVNGARERVAVAYMLLGNYDETVGSARAPIGNYVLTWEGTGGISWGHHKSLGVFNLETVTTNRIEREYSDIGKGFQIRINWTDPTDPIRSVKLMLPGYEDSGKLFTDWAIEDASNYDTIRTMDWKQVNFSFESLWSERILPSYVFQGRLSESHFKFKRERYRSDSTGVAWEYIIELANQSGSNLWVNIPAMADDNYVRQLAIMMRDNLNPSAKLYVEYSNEVWNSGTFPVYNYCKEMGIDRGYLGDSGNTLKDESTAAFRFQGARSVEIFEIFYDEFNVSAQERLVRVIAGQATNTSIFENILNFEYLPGQLVHDKVDALAIAPYIGHKVVQDLYNEAPDSIDGKDTSQYTVNDVMTRLTDNLRGRTKKGIASSSAIAEKYGKTLIAYEGGQHLDNKTGDEHLNDLIVEAQYTEEMGDVYREFLGYWFLHANGDVFANYTNITPCSKHGCWGVRQYYDQTEDEAPKFKALMDALRGNLPATPNVVDGVVISNAAPSMCQSVYDINDNETGLDVDIAGEPINYTIIGGNELGDFSIDRHSGEVFITSNDLTTPHNSELNIQVANSGVTKSVVMDLLIGDFAYENLSNWSSINKASVIQLQDGGYRVTKGIKEYASLKKSLGQIEPNSTVRIVFSSEVSSASGGRVTVKLLPYTGFADSAGGHVQLAEGVNGVDVTFTNNTGGVITNASVSITFDVGSDHASDYIDIHNMMIIQGN